MRTNKYNYYHVLQGNYGYGWDDVGFYDSNDREQMAALKRDIRTYRESEPNFSHRVIQRRELNPEFVVRKATIHYEIGHTKKEWLSKFKDNEFLWDFPADEFFDGAVEPNESVVYWYIEGRFYETDIEFIC